MKVFIIDDDELFGKSLARILAKKGLGEIYEYNSLSDALGKIDLNPEVIVLDHFLQGNEGVDIIPFIKERLPNTKILYVSGQSNVEILAEAKRLGATQFFKKDDHLADNIYNSIHSKTEESTAKSAGVMTKIKALVKKKKNTKLFVVDDDELYSVFLRYKLSKVGNFDIHMFKDGVSALAKINDLPDILILDYHLVEMTGDAVLKRFKTQSPTTKVIILSSQDNIDIAMGLFNLGIDDYVVKNKNWEENLLFSINKISKIPLNIKS